MWREVLIRREKAGRGKSDLALQSIGGDMGARIMGSMPK